MAYTFDPIFAQDPNNPNTVAKDAAIILFDPADVSKAPIVITDPTGSPLPNPITVDAFGMGPAFQHPTLERVGWFGAGFTNYLTSYEGMKNTATEAKTAAQTAANNAASAASEVVTTAAVNGSGKLILTKASGATQDAGSVIGPVGPIGPKGLDGSNVLPTDDAIEQAIITGGTKTKAALSATYLAQAKLPYIDVDLQRLPADTDDAVVWQRAVNAAKTLGIKRVVGRAAEYIFKSYVDLGGCNGISIEGAGRKSTIIRPGIVLNYAFTAFTDASDLVFRDIGFIGTAVDDAVEPRRARTFTGHTGFAVAIKLQAAPMVGYTNTLKNVTLDNVHIEGTSTLPVLLGGVKGEAKIVNSTIHNCMDVGFIFCDSTVFIGNTVSNSADNGVSMSRGNKRVVCTGNSFNNCAYWAIWVAGYDGDAAPKDITITGNIGTMLGHGGVTGALGARNGVIAGNTFKDIRRGPIDQRTDDACGVGIFLSSFPSDPTAPTIYAENWSITGNTIIDAERGGVLLSGGVRNVSVYSNVFVRMGSQFYADGTTTVTTAASGQNFGVAAEPTYSALVKNIDIQANQFIDDRATPLMNNAAIATSAVNWTQNNNKAVGSRLQMGDSAKSTGGVQTFTGEARFSAGWRIGFSGATGTVGGRITGAAGATRSLSLQTEDVTRWQAKANSSTESGSNAGSDFQLEAFSDAGASLGAAFTVVRSTQGFRHENKPLGFYGAAPIAKQTGTPAAATDLATALALINDLRAKLLALGIVG